MEWRLGTMGFGYREWAGGVFYPPGRKQAEYLSFYASQFDALELDTTFYAIPAPERVRTWASAVPEGFRFCPKTPRTVTHERPGDDGVADIRAFVDAVRRFEDKLGVILVQFPPSLTSAAEPRVRRLIGSLPDDLRFAVEFRHASWWNPATGPMLSERRIAWVAADYGVEPEPSRVALTSDFVYLRFVGQHRQFAGATSHQIDVTDRLRWWTERIAKSADRIETVWAMFNNDYAGHAIETLDQFRALAGLPEREGTGGAGMLFG